MKNLDNIILVFEELNEKKPKIEVDKRYSENPESTDILKKIEVSKEKVRKYLIEFLNAVIGVGVHGDSKIENQIPTEEEFNKIKAKTMSEINKLINNEDRAPVRYFTDEKKNIGKQLKKLVSRVIYSELDFDEKEEPATYKELEKAAYANVLPELDSKNPKVPDEFKKIIGKPMYNADVYEDLIPFISKKNKTDVLKNAEDAKDVSGYLKKNIPHDLLSKEPTGYEGRKEKMIKAVDDIKTDEKGDITDDSSYKNARENEKRIDLISKAKEQIKTKDWKENNEKEENKSTGKLTAADLFKTPSKSQQNGRSAYAAQRQAGLNALNSGSREKNEVTTLSKKQTTEIINKWIAEKAPKDKDHTIKLFGNFPHMGSAYGVLIFVPGQTAKTETAIKVDGEYGFKAHKTWYNDQLTAEQREYVKDYRKNSEFKSKVLAQWKTSIATESYFNY